MSTANDLYAQWLGIREPQRPLNNYQILGLTTFEQDPQAIEQAFDAQKAKILEHAKGQQARLAKRILAELESARFCLTDPQTRALYDDSLRGVAQNQTHRTSAVAPAAIADPLESLPPLDPIDPMEVDLASLEQVNALMGELQPPAAQAIRKSLSAQPPSMYGYAAAESPRKHTARKVGSRRMFAVGVGVGVVIVASIVAAAVLLSRRGASPVADTIANGAPSLSSERLEQSPAQIGIDQSVNSAESAAPKTPAQQDAPDRLANSTEPAAVTSGSPLGHVQEPPAPSARSSTGASPAPASKEPQPAAATAGPHPGSSISRPNHRSTWTITLPGEKSILSSMFKLDVKETWSPVFKKGSAVALVKDDRYELAAECDPTSKKLDGLLTAVFLSGHPKMHASYMDNKRDGTLTMWNEQGQLIYFEKSRNDKVYDVCCLFKDNLPWLIEDYDRFSRVATYRIVDYQIATVYRDEEPVVDDDWLGEALSALSDVRELLARDEIDYRRNVRDYIDDVRRQLAQQKSVASRDNILSAMRQRNAANQEVFRAYTSGVRRGSVP